MTGTIGIFLALVAGWFVAERRQVVLAVVVPLFVVLVVQTAALAAGLGVSPPSTVDAFPGLIGYYVVQAIILALALGIALQISALRFRGGGAGRARIAYVLNGALCILVVCLYKFDRSQFDPGSVAHHTSSGSPPLLGVLGIVLSAVLCLALGCVTLWRRRARPTEAKTA